MSNQHTPEPKAAALEIIRNYRSEAERQRGIAVSIRDVKSATELRGALIALRDVSDLISELVRPALLPAPTEASKS